MNRRNMISLAAILGLVIALPQVAFTQSNSLIGTWKINFDKSKVVGQLPRSITLTYQQDGENIRLTRQVIDTQGNTTTTVAMHIYDGRPHPVTGNAEYDMTTYTLVDANTFIYSRLKDGKVVAAGNAVISQDGKTLTITQSGTGSIVAGAATAVAVYEKQ